MEIRRYLNDDGLAALALCSAFGQGQGAPAPLRLSEWNQLARRIYASCWKTPRALVGRSAAELAAQLSLPSHYASRIVQLLERSARMTLQLESLFSSGIWAVSRMDELYPARLRHALRSQAPVVLFGTGEISRLNAPGIAIVGSRNIDEAGAAFAEGIAGKAANAGFTVISGGARGADRIAMEGAIQAGGIAIGALAESLNAALGKRDVQQLLSDRRLVLLTPHAPNTGFSVGAAMTRNKMIYALAESAIVVSSEFQRGGTWAGAVEALEGNWCPVFARDGASVPRGNRELMKLGAAALPEATLKDTEDFAAWIRIHGRTSPPEADLFCAERRV
jgi:DNA processing protein